MQKLQTGESKGSGLKVLMASTEKRKICHSLGGWWETCSATKHTLLGEDQGTGPSDMVSCRVQESRWQKGVRTAFLKKKIINKDHAV